MIGASVQPRRPSITSIRRCRADRGRGPRHRAAAPRHASAPWPVAASVDLVVAGAQVDRQRPPEPALVLDHEHAGHRGAPRRAARRSRIRIVRPPPSVRSATIAPSIASTKPRATERPSPTPSESAVVEALERLEDPRPLRVRARPARDRHLDLRAVPAARAVTSTGPSPAPWRRALSTTFTITRCSSPVSASPAAGLPHVDRDPLAVSGSASSAPATTSSSATGSRRRSALPLPGGWRRAGCRRPHRADQPSPPAPRAGPDAPSRKFHVVKPERPGGRLDPRQRRAEVVSDSRE